jgi:beta-N-acetylhexosaminidase
LQRAEAALTAVCDMVLVCNDPEAADALLAGLQWNMSAISLARLARMHGRPNPESMVKLHETSVFVDAVKKISGIGIHSGTLPLG